MHLVVWMGVMATKTYVPPGFCSIFVNSVILSGESAFPEQALLGRALAKRSPTRHPTMLGSPAD